MGKTATGDKAKIISAGVTTDEGNGEPRCATSGAEEVKGHITGTDLETVREANRILVFNHVGQTSVTRGTVGFVRFSDKDPKHPAIVEHVFSDRRLKVHYSGNKRFRTIITADLFSPSRDAYWCEGSWVEPEWNGGSSRCTNYWAKEDYRLEGNELVKFNPNCATNIMTDEQALGIYVAD